MSKFYLVKEVAKMLGIAEQTVRNHIATGKIKHEKIYNSTVVPKEEVNKHLKLRGKEEIE